MQELTTFINHHPLLSGAAFIVFIFLVVIELIRAKRNAVNASPAQVTQLINRENAAVLDIRDNEIFRKGHIIGAQSIKQSEILDTPKKLEKFRTRPIVMVADMGHESQKIAAHLLKQGYNAYSLKGGMRAWIDAQMPLVEE